MVVPRRVEFEAPQQLAVAVEDSYPVTGQEQHNPSAGELANQPDVVELVPVADGHYAMAIDPVVTHAQFLAEGPGRPSGLALSRNSNALRCVLRSLERCARTLFRGDEGVDLACRSTIVVAERLLAQEPLERLVGALDLCRLPVGGRGGRAWPDAEVDTSDSSAE